AAQARLEHGLQEEDLPPSSGLGRGRLRRLSSLLELQPALRQALREGRLKPQIAFAAARLSGASQDELAAIHEQEGELTTADLKRLGEAGGASNGAALDGADGSAADDDGEMPDVASALARL